MACLLKKMFLFSCALLVLTGCKETTFRDGVVVAGGRFVSADTLNLGKSTYTEYCIQCHGPKGDGNGVSSKGLYPPPRNFTQGLIKFGDVVAGTNPTDESLKHNIRHGLNGSAMLPWDISDERLDAVVQYIKTFSPNTWIGEDKKLGEKIVPNVMSRDAEASTADPFGLAYQQDAIEKGKEVYHIVAQCWTCHRAYISKEEAVEISKKYPDNTISMADIPADYYVLKNQDSDYGVKMLPPDYTWHYVRSANTVEELFVRLSAGVAGTTMPSWKGTISNKDIWAVAYYVKYLMDLRNTPARQELIGKLPMGVTTAGAAPVVAPTKTP